MSAVVKKVNINGVDIPVVYESDKNLPIVSFQLVIKNAGSIQDGGKDGLARFSANVLGEGSKSRGSVAFAEELENRAISLGATAGAETFVFEISSLKEQFDFATGMLKELLDEPNFSKSSIEKIKHLTIGSLSSKKSDFDYIASLNIKKIIFKDTPIGHAYSGEMESIEKIELKDVEDFYKKHIDLANMLVVVGGDIEFEEIEKTLLKLLKDVQVGKVRDVKHYSVNEKTEEIKEVKDTQQAYIYFGAPYNLKANDESVYKSKVAGFILGESGFGSRLMEEIRVKRGLAYSAYSRTNINRSNSYFSGHLQTKNENLEDAKKIVISEIKRFVDGGVTQNELDQAKRFLLGSEPLRNETLSQRLSRAFFEYYRGFALGHSVKQLKLIESLTLKDLNSYIKQHDEITKLSFSIVTDAK